MKTGPSPWEQFHDLEAPNYDQLCFTQNTGRHAVELARRGYAVTGIDLSSGMLAQARDKAKAAQVEIDWIQENACTFSLDKPFDAVICLCEGSFGLLGAADDPNEQPLAILRNVRDALKPGGKTIFTMLNAYKMIRERTQEDIEKGQFDPLTLTTTTDYSPGEGQPVLPLRERAFTPTEITLLFQLADLSVQNIWGSTAGNWGKRAIALDEFEIMVVAQKAAQ
jgi:SAM-dependent methyltransferase